jgi:hypothetical protein
VLTTIQPEAVVNTAATKGGFRHSRRDSLTLESVRLYRIHVIAAQQRKKYQFLP